MTTTTYSALRERLAEVWDRVEDTREPVIVTRRGHGDLALLPAEELAGLLETVHLLRSPANARRLLGALGRTAAPKRAKPTTPAAIRRTLGIETD